MSFYEVVQRRLSVRKYTGQAVPEEALQRILEAARIAPSACNKQPWHFYVIKDESTRKDLFRTRMPWAGEAPVVIVACSLPDQAWVRSFDGKNHADIDLAITFEHIVLAAAAEGLGTCWICAFDPEHARAVLKLPEGMEPVAITPLGYAAIEVQPQPRKAMEEIVTVI